MTGALPNVPTKQRRVAILRENADYSEDSVEPEDASSDGVFVAPQAVIRHAKKSAPKGRRSEPATRVEKTTEYEEDVGRMESQ